MYPPELLDRVKSDDLFKKIVPVVDPSARGLCEPERPLVLERVLDVEIVLVVEDGDELAVVVFCLGAILVTIWGDGYGGEIDLLVHLWHFRFTGSHYIVPKVMYGWLRSSGDCWGSAILRNGQDKRRKKEEERERQQNLGFQEAGLIAGQRTRGGEQEEVGPLLLSSFS